jgi:hypothetical protein
MSSEEQMIREACLAAAVELGVRVVAPFNLQADEHSPVEFIALFPDFGSPNGTAVCHFRDWPRKNPVAASNGFYCSGLHPDSYLKYKREQFIDAFIDWGWQGRITERPAWLNEVTPRGA